MPEMVEMELLPRMPEGAEEKQWERARQIGNVTVARATANEILATKPCFYRVKPEDKRVIVEHRASLDLNEMTVNEMKILAAKMGKPVRKAQISKRDLIGHIENMMNEVEVIKDDPPT